MIGNNNRTIYVTGDTHGDFRRVARFCEDNGTTKNDTLIILGDAGINYYCNSSDIRLKRKLEKLPITLFCIHGNHETRPQNIDTYIMSEAFGGTCFTEPEFPGLMFAIDGEVYSFANKSCIVIGGAYSVDKYYRLSRGAQWFADEQPDEATKRMVEESLGNHGNRIDVVLSHTCPARYVPTEMFLPFVDQSTVDTSTEEWLAAIESKVDYGRWLCGHYHTDKTVDKLRFMFNDIMRLEDA